MEYTIEQQRSYGRLSLMVATVNWDAAEAGSPMNSGYVVCQRLSGASSPVRIENVDVHEALARVGSVGFLPPDCSVGLLPVDRPYRILVCAYERAHFESVTGVTRAEWEAYTGLLVTIRNHRIELLMQELHAEFESPGFGHTQLVEALGSQLLVELARYALQLRQSAPGRSDSLALAPWQLNRIQQRIEASQAEGYPDLAELAELCGVSQGHLMRCFKASTGWQIHKYIAGQRISAARRLLVRADLSCAQVADRLGYGSAAYFATAFRRHTGLTPTQYRRQALANAASTQFTNREPT